MTVQGKYDGRALNTITLQGLADTSVTALIYDKSKHMLLATGTTVPTDDTAGFAKGCLFIDTDVAAGTSGLYVNIGTNALCNFNLVTNAAD